MSADNYAEPPLLTLLLVEDDDAVATLMWEALREEFHVLRAASVAQAMAVLDLQRVDGIVLDWHLNGRTAGLLLERIRRREGQPVPPTLVATGDQRPDVAAEARAAGATAVIHKPFRLEHLLEAVWRMFEGPLPQPWLLSQPDAEP